MNKTATISAALAFIALILPALSLGQKYASDVDIDKEKGIQK